MKQNIKFIILGLIITAGVSYTYASNFSYPCAGAPDCNTPLPINISATAQGKVGALSVYSSTAPGLGYIFKVSGKSYFDGLLTNGLLIKTGAGNGKIMKYNAATGVAGWGTLSLSTSRTTEMTIKDFSINVPRNSSATADIPSTYQYCALNQLGPDFSNSDFGNEEVATVCSVNRNSDGTWKLYGNRMDDPDFICRASCFSFSSKDAEYDKTNFVPSPGLLDSTQNRIMESQIGSGERRIYIR
jgi:hypothetical protein